MQTEIAIKNIVQVQSYANANIDIAISKFKKRKVAFLAKVESTVSTNANIVKTNTIELTIKY